MRGCTCFKKSALFGVGLILLGVLLSGCSSALSGGSSSPADDSTDVIVIVPDQGSVNGGSGGDPAGGGDGGSSTDGGSGGDPAGGGDGGSSTDGGSGGDPAGGGDGGSSTDGGSGGDPAGGGDGGSSTDGGSGGDPDPVPSGPTAMEIIEQVISSLAVAASDDDDSILILSATVPEEVTVVWSADSNAVVIENDMLIGPDYTGGDSDLALNVQATVSLGAESQMATIAATVAPQCTTSQTALCQAEEGSAADPYKIYTVGQLLQVASSLDAHYSLQNDLDLVASASWNDAGSDTTVLEGFRPIGNQTNRFRGSFEGNGNIIENLRINRPNSQYIGLFGAIDSSAVISNLFLNSINYNGAVHVGGLVGHSRGTIRTITVQGSIVIGGMVGGVPSGQLGGGLVGTLHGHIEDSTAVVAITAASAVEPTHIGGLVGAASKANGLAAPTIVRSAAVHAIGDVIEGNTLVGGLIGQLASGSATDLYTNTRVRGNSFVGGLIGRMTNNSSVTNVYARGSVQTTGTTPFAFGGLIGSRGSSETVSNGYWDTSNSGQSSSAGGEGRTSSQLQVCTPTSDSGTPCEGAPTYSGWSTTVWNFGSASSYPSLR